MRLCSLSKFLLVLTTFSLIGLIFACLYHLFVSFSHSSLIMSKKNFVPSLAFELSPVNIRFGSITTSLVIAIVCFGLLITHLVPTGLEKVLPIEGATWSKFGFNVFFSVIVFFFAGVVGTTAAVFHALASLVVLARDLIVSPPQPDGNIAEPYLCAPV
jgi:hypothetical protein